jgi:hypothetical protein
MIDTAEKLTDAATDAASSKAGTIAATGTASGVIVTGHDPQIFGQWLAQHGVGVLSWIEIFQVIGSIYVTYKLLEAIINLIHSVRKKYAQRRRR